MLWLNSMRNEMTPKKWYQFLKGLHNDVIALKRDLSVVQSYNVQQQCSYKLRL